MTSGGERWECSATLQGHDDSIRELVLGKDGLLYSASVDKTVKVWSLDTWKCVRTIHGHADLLFALALGNRVLYTGGGKIW